MCRFELHDVILVVQMNNNSNEHIVQTNNSSNGSSSNKNPPQIEILQRRPSNFLPESFPFSSIIFLFLFGFVIKPAGHS